MVSAFRNLYRFLFLIILTLFLFSETRGLNETRPFIPAISLNNYSSNSIISCIAKLEHEKTLSSSKIKLERKRRKNLELSSDLLNPQPALGLLFTCKCQNLPVSSGNTQNVQSDYLIRGPPLLA